jgi:hypothetical protein
MNGSSTIGLAFLGVGALSLVIGILLYLRTRRFLGSAVSVQGLVTGMVEAQGSEGGTTYKPVVEFTTVDGQAVTFTDLVGSSPPRYAAGTTVKVMYPPGDPQAARIPSWFRLWFLSSFSALFGVIFVGVGAVLALSGGEAQDEITLPGISIPSGVGIPSGGISIPPGLIPSGVIPSIPPAGADVLVIQQGSGSPQPVPVSCDSVRDLKGGKDREVRLSFEGGSLTFLASPYTGPGAYTAGNNLEVGGTVFAKGDALSGAVVFDQTGQAGVVNLVAGEKLATGTWDCSGVKVS